jgi:hypothetical protein
MPTKKAPSILEGSDQPTYLVLSKRLRQMKSTQERSKMETNDLLGVGKMTLAQASGLPGAKGEDGRRLVAVDDGSKVIYCKMVWANKTPTNCGGQSSNSKEDTMDNNGLEGLIGRLCAEKEASDEKDFEVGKEYGSRYAPLIGYRQFRKYERLFGSRQPGEYGVTRDDLPEKVEEQLQDLLAEDKVSDADMFRQGWVAGLLEVWEELQGSL